MEKLLAALTARREEIENTLSELREKLGKVSEREASYLDEDIMYHCGKSDELGRTILLVMMEIRGNI